MVVARKALRIHVWTSLIAISACAEPVQPGADVVAGSYSADVLEYILDGEPPVSLLAGENRVEITIRRNGTFTASFTVPVALGSYNNPVQVGGRWVVSDGVLTLTGEPATFLDQTSFAAPGDGYLYGELLTEGALVRMRLVQSDP